MITQLIGYINHFLVPLETIIKKYQTHIGYFFILLSILSISLVFSSETVKFTGEQAMNVLWFLLFLPLFSRVFGLSLAKTLMPLRKEIGIFMGMLALVHGAGYIIPYPEMVLDSSFWFQDGFVSYLGFGVFALLCTIPLLLTSNRWAIQKLGKNWKRIHRLAYAIIILTVVHVVLIKFSREFEIGPVIILVVYFIGKTLEWMGIKLYKEDVIQYPVGQKWLCVPCGYIYDPLIGDMDSGIAPGTEFVDIPEPWRCPVCGVSKGDFVVYEEGNNTVITYPAKVIEKIFLNPTTIQLVIETNDITMSSKPGQFMSFLWSDDQGEFTRSYSIADQTKNHFTFLIKLTESGRGAYILQDIPPKADIRIKGIFGNFVLQNTDNQKIFIATGTGLAPIYNMILSLSPEIKKSLYFSVATRSELFFLEQLHAIANLDLHIHVTREAVEGCISGRIDPSMIDTNDDTEWYLCGNPKMVIEARQKLAEKGYQKIYSEEF